MLLVVFIFLFLLGFLIYMIDEVYSIIRNRDWKRVVSYIVVYIIFYLIYIIYLK